MKQTNKQRSEQSIRKTNKSEEDSMSNDLISPENISKELLKSLFDAAFMNTSYASNGDLTVKETYSCSIRVSENKERIMLLDWFGFTRSSSRLQRLEAVNKVNSNWAYVSACVSDDTLGISYDIFIGGGVAGKDIVLAVKKFHAVLETVIAELADIVE